MSTASRRHFFIQVIAIGATVGTIDVRAQGAGPKVSESDPQAVALGYKDDTTKVDAKKYPQHQAAQHCANCSFWQGRPDDAWAGCAMFGRKQVDAGGWCSAFSNKPG